MKFDNFLDKVPSIIVDRGVSYFRSSYVSSLLEVFPNKWEAFVDGNYGKYKVKISIDDNYRVINHYCNCPYDGEICKHVVATLFEIEQKMDNNTVSIQQKAVETKLEWMQIIDDLPEDELRNFIKKYATKNPALKDELQVNYAKKSNKINIEYYVHRISNILEDYTHDYDYMNYRDVSSCTSDLDTIIADADTYLEKENYYEAFSIYAAISNSLIDVIENIDDSSGEMSGLIQEAINGIDNLLEKCKNKELNSEIYSWLRNEIKNDDYSNYGFDELEDVFFKNIKSEEHILDVINDIDTKIIKLESEKDSWSSEYNTERLLRKKHQLYTNAGFSELANNLTDEFIYIVEFRQQRIDEALSKNEYEKAIKFINEGITIAINKDNSGTVNNWQNQLLEIYQKLKNTEKIQALSLKMFKENTGDLSYYKIYKKTINKKDWISKREKIINHLIPKSRTNFHNNFSNNYAKFLVAEKMWNELFDEVNKYAKISELISYSKYLKDKYSDELILLFAKEIRKEAVNTGRNVYIELVRYLKELAKIKGGLLAAKNLKTELLNSYKNRPAMKDEFRAL